MTAMSRLRARWSKGAAITVGMTTATAATGIIGGADVAAITAGTIAAGTTGAATKDTDAMLAGMNAGFFNDFKGALDKCLKVTGETLPNKENTAKYEKLFYKYKRIANALAGIYDD